MDRKEVVNAAAVAKAVKEEATNGDTAPALLVYHLASAVEELAMCLCRERMMSQIDGARIECRASSETVTK